MEPDQLVVDAEQELRFLASALTDPRERECLLCYVYRMLEHGCSEHRWTARYRDLRAPRATALERRLDQLGGFCDCEIFMNAYEPVPALWTRPPGNDQVGRHVDEDEVDEEDELIPPEVLPGCLGVRAGSTQGCAHWVRQWRSRW